MATMNGRPGADPEVTLRGAGLGQTFLAKKHSLGDVNVDETDQYVRRSQSLQLLQKYTSDNVDFDEGYLIGRRQSSVGNLARKSRSHVRITEVVSPYKMLFSAPRETESEVWKTPVSVFSAKKRGKAEDDKKLSRRMRSYYKDQDELIQAYEDIQLDGTSLQDTELADKQLQTCTERLAQLSLAVNLVLMVVKVVAVALSGSISIISSLVDSVVDLLSGIIIWWTSKAIKNRNIYVYPGGRSRLEPIAIVILSVIMSLASFQLIVESIQIIAEFARGKGSLPTMDLPTILIASGTVASKLVLFLLCFCLGRGSSSIRALAQDHRNDVLSNIVAVICGYFGSREFISVVSEDNVKYVDPLGAILISVYILVNWWRTGYEQIKMLTGHTADPNFLSKITWICLNHHREIIYIDTVRAFHYGNNFLVEVDIVLPEEMSLKMAHNIGEALQQKLEKFERVERAFVHLDYEIEHNPNEEHKVV
ncbi:uncharacterized protein LOC127830957 [Dreissena polymorpha]|uniref:Cation efflux protein cytoplasmic domain-containing protein n=1 Tax=Dreissena polymorpha TaxID=45954 RepID=A0A9D4H5W2_DREPO|nr:uncharacterized protein LOC127830957 [Dreissena polymorpha]XP_052211866.1 uncharacterized protein LOC127830957 [Dreissena polymorpha]XP_052211867.1 uncharacterized protein LOC127830957 [Dreissena polymorpha]XP_052211868.1 uncharacterized protein LOC127830957 [Dreissena polymorpha]KAH3827576.1 hypothetical protein DPMN_129513 [Dreissena polymorpha]